MEGSRSAERSLLGALLIDSGQLERVRLLVDPEDFESEANRHIYRACIGIADGGERADLITVPDALERLELLDGVGGTAYVSGLVDGVPDVESAPAYARLVREAAITRELATIKADLDRSPGEERQGDRLERFAGQLLALAARSGSGTRGLAAGVYDDPVAIFGAEVYTGERYPTHIPGFDHLLADAVRGGNGGLAPGWGLVIGGAPGAGKSVLASQLACELHKQGAAVAMLVNDEDRTAPFERFGQAYGLAAKELTSLYPRVVAKLSFYLAGRLRVYPDPAVSAPCYIEDVAADLMRMAPDNDALRVLVVDSLQTAKSRLYREGDTPKTRVEKNVAVLRKLCKKHGLFVIAISQLNRAGYGPKQADARTNDIASFSEASAVEYQMDIAMILREEQGHVRARLIKNRLGRQNGEFLMMLNRPSATFREVDEEKVIEARTEERDRQASEKEIREESGRKALMVAVLRKYPGGIGRNAALVAAGGNKTAMGRTLDLLEADSIAECFEAPRVPGKPGVRGSMYRLAVRNVESVPIRSDPFQNVGNVLERITEGADDRIRSSLPFRGAGNVFNQSSPVAVDETPNAFQTDEPKKPAKRAASAARPKRKRGRVVGKKGKP